MNEISSAVMSLAEKRLKEFKIRNGQVVAKTCPFCHGGNNHDEDTFAIGLYNGAFSCLRGGCGKTGSFRDLCEYFGEKSQHVFAMPQMETKKAYEKINNEILQPITEDVETYFALRKISKLTLDAFHIASSTEGYIIFPFYRDGVLTYVKYRKPKKHTKADGPKEWSIKNTEPILFGMDNVAFNKPLFITEGEIDALSLYEAGISNVVSVPSGCNNLEWITICWEWLEKFQQIVLFGDGDEPGQEMIHTLMKRLGEDRCLLAPNYPDLLIEGVSAGRPCKDANEILYAYGPDALKEIADSCEPAPIKGILNLASIPFVDPTAVPRIFSKIPALDNAIGGFAEGSVTVLTGKRGQGKSTITGQFCNSAIQQGYSCCAYSGELSPYKFLEWIMLQATESKYIGTKTDKRSGKLFACVDPEIQNRIKKMARWKVLFVR